MKQNTKDIFLVNNDYFKQIGKFIFLIYFEKVSFHLSQLSLHGYRRE